MQVIRPFGPSIGKTKISNNKLNGFIASRFNNSSYLSSSKFGIKWNNKNLYLNLFNINVACYNFSICN